MTQNSSESLEQLYKLFLRLKGPKEAQELVVAVVTNSIYEIQNEGLEFTAEIFSEKVTAQVNDFLKVAKATQVA